MVRRLVFASVSVIALSAAANAADMYAPAPAGPGGYKDAPYFASWAGFYAGVNGGYGWSEFSDQLAIAPFGGLSPSGGFGGGQIGYNLQSGSFVYGLEADIQGAGIEDKATLLGATFKSSLDWFGTVRARLGYSFGSSLLYGTGGFAFGGIDNEVSAGGLTAKNSTTATGYTVGGGLEYKVNPAWSVKAEYQFINLGRNDPTLFGANICTPGTFKCEDDAFHTVRAGLNYHFGSGYTPLK